MPLYLKYGSIMGDATEDAHRGWIELTSFGWGVGRGSGGGGSVPSVSEAVVTKGQDSASPALYRESVSGQPVDAYIDFVRDDGSVYLRIAMSGTMISGWALSGSGDNPTESITLNFTKVDVQNNPGTPPP